MKQHLRTAIIIGLGLQAGIGLGLIITNTPPAAAAPLPTVQSKAETGVSLNAACSTLGASAGINLASITGWRAIAVASTGVASSRTFTSGTATCCFKSSTTEAAAWVACDSRLNITLVSGAAAVPTPDITSFIPKGRLAYIGTSVAQSAGSDFTIVYEWVTP